MPRKRETPKLNLIKFRYNGDQNKFKEFLSSMAAGYLNSGKMPELPPVVFVDWVEFSESKPIPLDK